jgi:hypothetical protein
LSTKGEFAAKPLMKGGKPARKYGQDSSRRPASAKACAEPESGPQPDKTTKKVDFQQSKDYHNHLCEFR